ncbi:MAG: hypothetical protein AB1418_11750 [Pseudomonadota bacterium]
MSTNKTLVAVCVLVFLCGLSIGIFSSSWILQTDSQHDLKTIANLSDAAYDAYSKRDQVTSKNVLLDFLNALNSSIESNKAKRKALLLDKALTPWGG